MAVADLLLNILSKSDKRGLSEAADELDNLGRKAEQTGKKFDGMAKDTSHVDEEIEKSKAKIRELGEEFDRTGNKSDVFAKLRSERSNLAWLTRIKKDLEDAGDQGGQGFVAKLTSAVSSGLSSLPAPEGLVQWLVAGGVLAAPALLAAIDGAMLAGAGTIGIGSAIAVQAKDPQIQAAYKDLGGVIMADLTDATAGFKGPLIALAGDFRKEWAGVLPGLKADWDALAPVVERFGEGVGGLVTHMMPGFNAAIQASVPIISMLANELPRVGDAFSSLFQSLAAGGEGGKMALQDTLVILEGMVITLGKLTEAGSKAFAWLDKANLLGVLAPLLDHVNESTNKNTKSLAELNAEGNKAQQALANLGPAAENAGLGVQLASDDFKTFSAAINVTRSDTDALAGSMVDRIIGATMGMDRATLGVHQSLTQLSETLKQNTVSAHNHAAQLDMDTAAGQANRGAVLGAVAANVQQYDAQIKAGLSAQDAAAAYDQNTAALEKQLRQAHLTQGQIDGLIGKYRGVPRNVDTDIAMHGLQSAIEDLDSVIRRVNGLDGRVSVVTVEEVHRTTYVNSTAPSSVFHGLAAGGIVRAAQGLSGILAPSSPGTMILAGEPETGGEIFAPLKGISQQRAMMLGQTLGDAYGFQVSRRSGASLGSPSSGGSGGGEGRNYNITVMVAPGGSPADQGAATVQAIKEYEKYNGAGWRN